MTIYNRTTEDSELVRSLLHYHCPATERRKKMGRLRRPFKHASKKLPEQYFLAAAEHLRDVLLQYSHDCNNMNTKALQKQAASRNDWWCLQEGNSLDMDIPGTRSCQISSSNHKRS